MIPVMICPLGGISPPVSGSRSGSAGLVSRPVFSLCRSARSDGAVSPPPRLSRISASHVTSRIAAAFLCAALVAAPAAAAQQSAAGSASHFVLAAGEGRDTISRHIYGQFAEHLGRLIYDGIWTRRSASEPWHMRDDVVPAMNELREVADQLESAVPHGTWPFPTYREMLFIK